MWWDCLSQNVKCHPLSVGHEERCDETAFYEMCNITHKLSVIGMRHLSQNVQQWHSLPVGHRKTCNVTAIHKICNVTHLLLVGHRKRCDENVFTKFAISPTCCWSYETTSHKMCNITHSLLVAGKHIMTWRLPFKNVQCHPLPIGHRTTCNETSFHKICNITHFLLVIGKDVVRLPFTKCPMSLTCCWS